MLRDDIFKCRGVRFTRKPTCAGTYFWVSDCGRILCGDKTIDGPDGRKVKTYLVKIDGRLMFGKYPSLKLAMDAAVEAAKNQAEMAA